MRGRLEGLNELIRVLRESLASGQVNALSTSLVEHVSSELEELVSELKGTLPKQEIKKIEEKHEELKKAGAKNPEVNPENVKKAEDLMQSLMALQK